MQSGARRWHTHKYRCINGINITKSYANHEPVIVIQIASLWTVKRYPFTVLFFRGKKEVSATDGPGDKASFLGGGIVSSLKRAWGHSNVFCELWNCFGYNMYIPRYD